MQVAALGASHMQCDKRHIWFLGGSALTQYAQPCCLGELMAMQTSVPRQSNLEQQCMTYCNAHLHLLIKMERDSDRTVHPYPAYVLRYQQRWMHLAVPTAIWFESRLRDQWWGSGGASSINNSESTETKVTIH